MSIASRLTKLENLRPASLVVLARMLDGTELEMSAREYAEISIFGNINVEKAVEI